MNCQLSENVFWVGYVDWNVRDFHGYETTRGSSYNAYLIKDQHPTLIDTVKAPYAAGLLKNVAALVPLDQLRYLVCNHAEPDHAGSLAAVINACPQVEVVCDAKCREALGKHQDVSGWKFRLVKSGDTLSTGSHTLQFLETPMAHWPESMATFLVEKRILFSMDAFGQHYSSTGRFDDEEPIETVMEEAKTYYANILIPYGKPVQKALDAVAPLHPAMLAPSHGVIWRKHIPDIIARYRDWSVCKLAAKVLIMYDTMWKSTEMMAHAILEGAQEVPGVDVRYYFIRATTGTALMTETLDAACLAVGSPTLNMALMPQVAAVLTYMKGLRPSGKTAFAFGSYGWGRGGPEDVEQYLQEMKFELLRPFLKCQFVPSAEVLQECRQAGKLLAEKALDKVRATQ